MLGIGSNLPEFEVGYLTKKSKVMFLGIFFMFSLKKRGGKKMDIS